MRGHMGQVGPVAAQVMLLLAVIAAVTVIVWAFLGFDWQRFFVALLVGIPAAAFAAYLLAGLASARSATQTSLQSAEARVVGIVESAMDPIVAIDEAQRIVLFNAAAEAAFRWPRHAVIGQPIDMLIPTRFRDDHRRHVERFGHTGTTSRRMGSANILSALRADGEEFPIEASISQHIEAGKPIYTVILRDVSARILAETELRKSKDELKALASAAASAREQEKLRIARELHDELAQAMTGLKMDVGLLRLSAARTGGELPSRLDKMDRQIDQTIASVRRIAADLRPLTLDDFGLVPAIESLVTRFREQASVECELAMSHPEFELTDLQATAVFRIIQEALTNVARHARATQVEVTIVGADDQLVVTVRDNGVGFAPGSTPKPTSFGLLGLKERAYLLGGEARVSAEPGAGTEVEVWFPLSRDGAPA